MDIVFIKPTAPRQLYGALSDYDLPAIEPPMWEALLAGWLQARGYQAAILDPEAEGCTLEESARRAAAMKPRLAAIVAAGANPIASTMSMAGVRTALEQLAIACPEVPRLVAGVHPTALPERTLREEPATYVCAGEGFMTLPPLLEALRTGASTQGIAGLWQVGEDGDVIEPPPATVLENLDAAPDPAWELLPMGHYRAHNWHCFGHIDNRMPYGLLYTTLGCPYRCAFCCTQALFGRPGIRRRSPERVVGELDTLVNRYGIRNIKIPDEMFALNREHVGRLCDLIADRGYDLNIWAYARINTVDADMITRMARAGIRWLAYGIESGSQEVLEASAKGYDPDEVDEVVRMTRDAGIHIVGNYIFGLPDDDMDSMKATFELALRVNAEWANFYTAMALPGSALYRQALEEGWALPDTWEGYSQYGYETLPLPTRRLTAGEVLRFRDEAFHAYYANPAYLGMIERTFGTETVAHVREMASHRLARRHA